MLDRRLLVAVLFLFKKTDSKDVCSWHHCVSRQDIKPNQFDSLSCPQISLVGQVSHPVSDFPVRFEFDTRRVQRHIQATVQRATIDSATGLHDIASGFIRAFLPQQARQEKCQSEKGESELNENEWKVGCDSEVLFKIIYKKQRDAGDEENS